jgi:voltage-gated potassium channel
MATKHRSQFLTNHPHWAPLVVLFKAFVGIWIVIAFGTTGYRLIEGWPVLDCFYMTMITLTTIGFGEIYPLSPQGRVFTVVIIFLGFGIVGYSALTGVRFFIEGEFTRILKRRRDMKAIEELRNHYVVCGFGRMGSFICHEFDRRDVPFVVVEKKSEVQEHIRDAGYLLSPGDATQEEVLRAAGIDKAKGLVSVLESDAANLYTVLTGRQLNSGLDITARAGERSAQRKLKLVGADRVINPYLLGGMRLVIGVLKPDVLGFLDVVVDYKERQIEIEQLRIREGSAWCGKKLADTRIAEDRRLIVLSIKKEDGQLVFNPEADTVLERGDTLIAIGDTDAFGGLGSRVS